MNLQLPAPERVFASTPNGPAPTVDADVDRAAERLLVRDFAVLAEAAGSPQKLRLLILTLAVTGRLSVRLATDGDAATLLAKLCAEQAPTGAQEEALGEHEVTGPATIPESWQWARFSRVASIDSHLVDPAEFRDLPHVAPDNIEKGTGRLLEYRTIREDGVTSSKHRFFAGQIVYSKIRPNLSKAVVVDFDGLCSADMYPLTARIDRRFFHCFLLSPVFLVQVVKGDNRLAMPKVNQEQLGATVVPVPPLAEQKRIVARVDQLMALIDDLEAKQTKKRDLSTRFTKASLEALTTAESPEAFDTAWQRVVENFSTVLDASTKVGELRQAILVLAARGLLVRQEPNDRSAEALVAQCPTRQSEAEAEGRFKRVERLPPPRDEERGDFPIGWACERLGNLCRFIDYRGKTPTKLSAGTRLITAKNVRMGFVNLDPQEFIAPKDYPGWMTRGLPTSGDLLFTTEAPLGNVALFDFNEPVALAQRIIALHPFCDIDSRFLMFVLMSPWFQTLLADKATGMTATGIKASKLKELVVPIAPLAEQKRIVAKVDQLMKLCDDLEAKLRRAEDRASKLVEAVVQEMVP